MVKVIQEEVRALRAIADYDRIPGEGYNDARQDSSTAPVVDWANLKLKEAQRQQAYHALAAAKKKAFEEKSWNRYSPPPDINRPEYIPGPDGITRVSCPFCHRIWSWRSTEAPYHKIPGHNRHGDALLGICPGSRQDVKDVNPAVELRIAPDYYFTPCLGCHERV